MNRATATAIVAGLAILVAALVGWQGSRPGSRMASTRTDGVTVVPATDTPGREDVRPSAAMTVPASPPADRTVPSRTDRDAVSMLGELDRVAAAFDRQPRDPAWSPGTEAGLRNASAGIAGLDIPAAAECRASLCRVTARTATDIPRDEADRTVAALQARTSAQTRASAPFTANHLNLERNEESGEANFTAYLLRR